jgi:hypothetical protein
MAVATASLTAPLLRLILLLLTIFTSSSSLVAAQSRCMLNDALTVLEDVDLRPYAIKGCSKFVFHPPPLPKTSTPSKASLPFTPTTLTTYTTTNNIVNTLFGDVKITTSIRRQTRSSIATNPEVRTVSTPTLSSTRQETHTVTKNKYTGGLWTGSDFVEPTSHFSKLTGKFFGDMLFTTLSADSKSSSSSITESTSSKTTSSSSSAAIDSNNPSSSVKRTKTYSGQPWTDIYYADAETHTSYKSTATLETHYVEVTDSSTMTSTTAGNNGGTLTGTLMRTYWQTLTSSAKSATKSSSGKPSETHWATITKRRVLSQPTHGLAASNNKARSKDAELELEEGGEQAVDLRKLADLEQDPAIALSLRQVQALIDEADAELLARHSSLDKRFLGFFESPFQFKQLDREYGREQMMEACACLGIYDERAKKPKTRVTRSSEELPTSTSTSTSSSSESVVPASTTSAAPAPVATHDGNKDAGPSVLTTHYVTLDSFPEPTAQPDGPADGQGDGPVTLMLIVTKTM